MTSSRLPGKVMLDCCGQPMLARMVDRLRRCRTLDHIVLCTTVNASDDPLAALAADLGIGCWRGSEDNVLSRVLDGARAFQADVIVELTGDCPLIDPALIDQVVTRWQDSDADYCANVLTRSYPIGMDTQVFPTAVLADVSQRTQDPQDLEHVSLYIYRHPELYRLIGVEAPPHQHHPHLRLTLDTAQDLAVIRHIYSALLPQKPDFGLDDILAYLQANPDVAALNADVAHRWV